jgi:hypothetical protein
MNISCVDLLAKCDFAGAVFNGEGQAPKLFFGGIFKRAFELVTADRCGVSQRQFCGLAGFD